MANKVTDWGVSYIDSNGTYFGSVKYSEDSIVSVENSTTNSGRFHNLQAAYEDAKLKRPGGNDLSSTNRSLLILTPGTYELGLNKLTIDSNFVDIAASVSVMGGIDVGEYQPNYAILTGTPLTNEFLVEITATDVRLDGISFVSRTADTVPLRLTQGTSGGPCVYRNIYQWVEGTTLENVSYPDGSNGMTDQNISGTWIDCVCSFDWAWRVNAWGEPTSASFNADMKNCHAGFRSFGGDCPDLAGWEDNFKMTNCTLENCKSGGQSFAGCGGWGIGIDETATFIECEAGEQSFGIGIDMKGTLIRCRGGKLCAGATAWDEWEGSFSGVAEDCVFDAGSLGGAVKTTTVSGSCSGTITGCVIGKFNDYTDLNVKETTLVSAKIYNSTYITYTTGFGLFKIGADGGYSSMIIGCNLQMYPASANHPIDSDASASVIFSGCTCNNSTFSATGLGSNVTNKAVTPSNGFFTML